MIRGRDQIPVHMLAAALARELQLIDDLRGALRRQRDSFAGADANEVDAAVMAVARTRLTLAEAQRGRVALMLLLTGSPTTSLDALDAYLDTPLPEAVAQARDAMRRATAALEHDLTLTRRVADRARDVEAALLQHFLSGAVDSEWLAPIVG